MKWKDWLNGGTENKKLQILLVIIVAAIALVYLSGSWVSPQPTTQAQSVAPNQAERELQTLETSLQSKIAGALQKIAGVGQVSVAVTLSSGPRSEFGANQTHSKTIQEETPSEGGKRVSTQTNDNSQMVLAGIQSGSSTQPVKRVELSPQISGVLVVAQGARDPYVLERIQKSVQTLLGVPASKIRVEPMESGGK